MNTNYQKIKCLGCNVYKSKIVVKNGYCYYCSGTPLTGVRKGTETPIEPLTAPTLRASANPN